MSRTDKPNPYDAPQTDCSPAERDRLASTAILEPPIAVRGRLNRQEFDHSLVLVDGQRRAPSKAWKWIGMAWIAAMCVVALGWIIQHPTWPGGYVVFLLFAAWLAYAVVFGPRAHNRLLDDLEQVAQAADEAEYILTTDGLISGPKVAGVRIGWENMTGFHDSDQMILLRQNQDVWLIPRRWFASDEDFSRLVIFLGHKVEMLS